MSLRSISKLVLQEAQEFKESSASDVGVEESAKAGQRRPAASEVKCTA
jgi:hypothetical protein